MGNGQSTERESGTPTKNRERSGSTKDAAETATAPSSIKKRSSIRRNRQVLTSSSPPQRYRKGSADTESTLDQADKLSLLDEPGSSVPQAHSRRPSVASSSLPDELDRAEGSEADSTTKIAITIKWSGKGQKVYLTGSFTQWRKKIGMQKNEAEGYFSVKLYLMPGTHRLKFNVDGEWKTNENMAVATDSSGNFVNYIEVLPSDANLALTREHECRDGGDGDGKGEAGETGSQNAEYATRKREENWTNTIPSFMTPSEELLQSPAMIPPTLPPHLEKVILNTSNERKDDHSVLPHPNHVVLNHLAASSIRNGVLAVSASTRYRKKYVTTIYQTAAPTSSAG